MTDARAIIANHSAARHQLRRLYAAGVSPSRTEKYLVRRAALVGAR